LPPTSPERDQAVQGYLPRKALSARGHECFEPPEFSLLLIADVDADTLALLRGDERIDGVLDCLGRRGLGRSLPVRRKAAFDPPSLFLSARPTASLRRAPILFTVKTPVQMFAAVAAFPGFVIPVLTGRGVAHKNNDDVGGCGMFSASTKPAQKTSRCRLSSRKPAKSGGRFWLGRLDSNQHRPH
jgi:hypothetical protein